MKYCKEIDVNKSSCVGNIASRVLKDAFLNYTKHLENCLKLISLKAYLLNKIRMYINMHTAVTIYKTMILPVMEYGDVIYDGANQKLLKDLQTSQTVFCVFVYKEINTLQQNYCTGYVKYLC